jgi:hypothetical protein
MAKRRSNRRAENHADFAGPDATKEAIEKLAKSAKDANSKAGHNSGEVPDETIARHVDLIKASEIEWREARDKAAELQGVLRNRYKVAKGDGVDIDSLKLAFRIAERSSGEVIEEQRNLGRYLKIMGCPLGHQWSLFEEPDADGAKPDATARGEQAGREGADRDSNPYSPGTPDWFAFNNGWQAGQDSIAATLGRGNGEAAAH